MIRNSRGTIRKAVTVLTLGLLATAVYNTRVSIRNSSVIGYVHHSINDQDDDDINYNNWNISYPKIIETKSSSVSWDAKSLDDLLSVPRVNCNKLMSLGGTFYICHNCKHHCVIDGNKYVCMDADVIPSADSCLVYSFGVGRDMTWDKAMVNLGCQVYSFDPTMENFTKAISEEPRLHYLPLGLSPNDTDSVVKLKDGKLRDQPMRSLSTIRRLLGHEERHLDVLKVDIEGAEWSVLEDLLKINDNTLSRVRQIAIELHLDDLTSASAVERIKAAQRYDNLLRQLTNRGFKMVHTELNKALQVFADVQNVIMPIFRESLFIYRPG